MNVEPTKQGFRLNCQVKLSSDLLASWEHLPCKEKSEKLVAGPGNGSADGAVPEGPLLPKVLERPQNCFQCSCPIFVAVLGTKHLKHMSKWYCQLLGLHFPQIEYA